jgi:hypothetical protein
MCNQCVNALGLVAITGIDVAFVGSLAALIAAIASPLSSWLTTRATHRHERHLAYDSRMFDARREMFQQATVTIQESLAVARDFYQRLADDTYRPEPIVAGSTEDVIVVSGSLAALGSDALDSATDAAAVAALNFFANVREFDDYLRGYGGRRPTDGELEELKTLLGDVGATRDRFVKAVRHELMSPPE